MKSKDGKNGNTGLESSNVTLVTIETLEFSNVTLVSGVKIIMGANHTKKVW